MSVPLSGIHRTASGASYVFGLDWLVAAENEREWPTLKQDHPPYLRMHFCKGVPLDAAAVDATSVLESESLLLSMAADLALRVDDTVGPWLFIAELPWDDRSFFMFGLADMYRKADDDTMDAGQGGKRRKRVVPRPEPEVIDESAADAIQTLSDYMSITELSGIAVWWAPVKEAQFGSLIEMLASKGPEMPLHDLDLETVPRISPRLPVFQQPKIIPVKTILRILLAGVVVGGLTWAGLTVRKALEPPPPPPPARMDAVVPAERFFSSCASAFAGWWPKGIGWVEKSSGCVMDSERLPNGVNLPALPSPAWRQMVVWREYVPGEGANRVLLEAVTTHMTEAWPNEAKVDTDRLLLWMTIRLPVTEAPAETFPSLQVMRSELLRAWPTGIARIGQTDVTGTLRIDMTGADLGDVSRRILPLQGLSPVEFRSAASDRDGQSFLILTAARRVSILVSDFTEATSRPSSDVLDANDSKEGDQ